MIRQWDLFSPILKKQCRCFGPVFKGRRGFNRKIRNGKKHVEIFPAGGSSMIPPRKISFHGSTQKEKRVPYQVQNLANGWWELPWGYTHSRRFWRVFRWAEWYATGESSSCRILVFFPDLTLWKISAELLPFAGGWWGEIFGGMDYSSDFDSGSGSESRAR